MQLTDLRTGEKVAAEIKEMTEGDYDLLVMSRDFEFDWQQESNKLVYKLSLIDKGTILGIIALIDIPKEQRIHIHLIESSKKNRQKRKRFVNVPGCLIAYAANQAFAKGYDGFVSLIPKTGLINYYMNTYGFRSYGFNLAIEGDISKALILNYL